MATEKEKKVSNELLRKYLGFATELVVELVITVFVGIFLDKKFPAKYPLFVWILPLLVIFATIIKVIKDVTRKN